MGKMEKDDDNKKNSDADLELKELCKVWGSAEAEVIKSFLQSNGISCIFRGKVVQSVHPFTADGLGEIKIFVSAKDYALAKELLKSHQK